jgi:predicted HicB family RNase H-like nuclease
MAHTGAANPKGYVCPKRKNRRQITSFLTEDKANALKEAARLRGISIQDLVEEVLVDHVNGGMPPEFTFRLIVAPELLNRLDHLARRQGLSLHEWGERILRDTIESGPLQKPGAEGEMVSISLSPELGAAIKEITRLKGTTVEAVGQELLRSYVVEAISNPAPH